MEPDGGTNMVGVGCREEGLLCPNGWSRVVVGDGDECAIECLEALILEEGRPGGGKNPCWGKECPEGGEATAR